MNIVCVAFGGGLGAVGRYLCGMLPIPCWGGFPVATLCVNFIGALIIGGLSGLLDNASCLSFHLSERAMLFLKVGFCGGFTTFSTFSLEMFNLLDEGKLVLSLTYAVISVALCLLGVCLGRYLVKIVFVK
ncbi:MAG: fluoride efflux transporter CrcB [Bacillota bacterium]